MHVNARIAQMTSREELRRFTVDELHQFLKEMLDLSLETLDSFVSNRIDRDSFELNGVEEKKFYGFIDAYLTRKQQLCGMS